MAAASPRPALAQASPATPTYEASAWMPYRTLMPDGHVDQGYAERPIIDALHGPTGNRGAVDLLCGGFPCQDLSVAGRRAGTRRQPGQDSSIEFARVIDAVRPSCVLLENVPGLLSSNGGRDFELRCLERWPTSGTAWHGGFRPPLLRSAPAPPPRVPYLQSTLRGRAGAQRAGAVSRCRLALRWASSSRVEKRGRALPAHSKSRAGRRRHDEQAT